MHDCSHTGDHLLDLVLHEINVEDSRDLLSEIEACKECFGNYQAMLRTLQVFDMAVEATLPQESYWHNYSKKLQSRLAQAAPPINHRRGFSAFIGFRFFPSLSLAGKLATALMILAVGLWAGIQLLNKPVNPPPVAQDQPAGNSNLATPPSPVNAAGKMPATGDRKNQVRLPAGQVTKSRMSTEEAVKLRRAAAPGAPSTNRERTLGRYAVAKERSVATPVSIEVAEHVEDMRLLLQSFKNARSSKNASDVDISFEKQLARRMLNQNAFFRRGAGSKKRLLVEELFADFEPFLLDVANLPDRSSQDDLRSINDLYGKGVLLALNLVELRM